MQLTFVVYALVFVPSNVGAKRVKCSASETLDHVHRGKMGANRVKCIAIEPLHYVLTFKFGSKWGLIECN